MSDLTKQIRDNFQTLVGTTLGATWGVIDNKYTLANNSNVNQTRKYGVVLNGGVDPADEGILKHYTVNRDYQLILLQGYIGTLNRDSNIEAAIDTLEDALDTVVKAAMNEKLSSPGIVLNVTLDSIDAPDLETLENVVILTANFIVKYRNSLN